MPYMLKLVRISAFGKNRMHTETHLTEFGWVFGRKERPWHTDPVRVQETRATVRSSATPFLRR